MTTSPISMSAKAPEGPQLPCLADLDDLHRVHDHPCICVLLSSRFRINAPLPKIILNILEVVSNDSAADFAVSWSLGKMSPISKRLDTQPAHFRNYFLTHPIL